MNANFIINQLTDNAVVIEDVGPWDKHSTVTNDAENVVLNVLQRFRVNRIFYYDSNGDPGELLIKDGKFAGFAPWNPKGKL